MTPELTALTFAALLGVVQFFLYTLPATREQGQEYGLSPRDAEPEQQLSVRSARLRRAFENHLQWLMLFAVAVGIIQMSGQNTGLTATCAWVYLIARVLYVPAYALGLSPWRSMIWMVGFFATIGMLLAALF